MRPRIPLPATGHPKNKGVVFTEGDDEFIAIYGDTQDTIDHEIPKKLKDRSLITLVGKIAHIVDDPTEVFHNPDHETAKTLQRLCEHDGVRARKLHLTNPATLGYQFQKLNLLTTEVKTRGLSRQVLDIAPNQTNRHNSVLGFLLEPDPSSRVKWLIDELNRTPIPDTKRKAPPNKYVFLTALATGALEESTYLHNIPAYYPEHCRPTLNVSGGANANNNEAAIKWLKQFVPPLGYQPLDEVSIYQGKYLPIQWLINANKGEEKAWTAIAAIELAQLLKFGNNWLMRRENSPLQTLANYYQFIPKTCDKLIETTLLQEAKISSTEEKPTGERIARVFIALHNVWFPPNNLTLPTSLLPHYTTIRAGLEHSLHTLESLESKPWQTNGWVERLELLGKNLATEKVTQTRQTKLANATIRT